MKKLVAVSLLCASAVLMGLSVTGAQEPAPRSYPKGNGLRVLATGHSWVAPALRTLGPIALADGYTGHHLLAHTSGGDKGSVRSIWASEQGLDYPGRNQAPPSTILLPAIATGQWDVMTWGVYRWDKPEDYFPWIDACLKANPAMLFYVQDGWPETREFTTPAGEYDLAALHSRQDFINRSVAQLVLTLNAKYPGKVHVIPVGDGICKLVTLLLEHKLPFITEVNSRNTTEPGIYKDGGHLDDVHSGLGWFEGYIYYATLYRKPPAEIKATFPVPDAALDKLFRELSWEVVTHHPLSGVTASDRMTAPTALTGPVPPRSLP
jgi:hypothetical protein